MRAPELFDLSGRTALVTGGGRGLGLHIARGLAEAGADVFLAGRKLPALSDAAAALARETGRRAVAVEADLGRPESVEALAERVLGETERLDVLVNNAATVWSAPTLEYPLRGWDRVFDVNARGLWLLTQRAARRMSETGGGSVVNVASISAFRGAPDEEQDIVAYNASKGAVVALTVDLAVKLASAGIRVNCIAPGPFDTDMMRHLREQPDRLRAYLSRLPLGRAGTEDDIKGAAVFLASPASAFITGHTLVVDGGALAR